MGRKRWTGMLVLAGVALLLSNGTLLADNPLVMKGNAWTYNNEIMGEKPSEQWDTQQTNEMARPVKWVLHKSGGNPVIWLIYDDAVSKWTTASIASDLQKAYKSRGINPDAVQQMTINNNDVYIIGGTDPVKNVRYNTAVFWRVGTKRAYNIELSVPTNEFSSYEPAYKGMIQTVKLLP
ncbi:MAG TPA: hypothetical protein VLJ37_10810 [bacterium]|nr:hypothetical protein [bacterium]